MSPTGKGKTARKRVRKTTARKSGGKTARSRKAAPKRKTPHKTGSKTSRKTGSKTGRKTGSKTGRKTGRRSAPAASRKTGPRGRAAAGAKRAARTSKPAVRRRRGSPKTRLPAILERLDKTWGAIDPPETVDVLEKAVYLVLREWGSATAVRKAMKTLRDEFVDWNDVRASSVSELARMMLGTGRPASLRRLHGYAERMRDMIDQVYNDRNDTSFDFLLDLKPKEQIEYLEDLDDLGLYNAYALVQWLSAESKGDDRLVLVSSELAQAAQRLGLVESAAVTRVRKELSALASARQLVPIQAHLQRLGDLEPGDWPASIAEYRP